MSYENETEVVLTKTLFEDWAKDVNGNAASMKNTNCLDGDKPFFYLSDADGSKYQLKAYEFKYDPEEFGEGTHTDTATAIWYTVDGHVILSHCLVGGKEIF